MMYLLPVTAAIGMVYSKYPIHYIF